MHQGLTLKLVSLTLVTFCDNNLLKTIGEHALCLKYLYVSSSWYVNEDGIRHLLFKVCEDYFYFYKVSIIILYNIQV